MQLKVSINGYALQAKHSPLLAYVLLYVKHKSFQKNSPKIKEAIILRKLKFPGWLQKKKYINNSTSVAIHRAQLSKAHRLSKSLKYIFAYSF